MATLGVVHYNTSSPHNKVNVLQQSSTNANNNNSSNNNTERREIIILRKTPHILPQSKDFVKQDVLLTNSAKKKGKNGGGGGGGSSRETRAQNPPPMAVARRNARERNRVKQVNNGFATLRQHIPHTIAAAFESNSGRGGNKKLSKVETLRMAVEYIRSLEDMLAMDDSTSEASEHVSSSLSSSVSVVSFPSPTTPSSPAITTRTNLSFSYPAMSPSVDDDDISTNPTPPPPQQYIRLTNNTYQLIPAAHLYDDSENLEPLQVDENFISDPSLIDADLQDLSLLHGSDSLSPGMYSDSSLSPNSLDRAEHAFIPVFHTIDNVKVRMSPAPLLIDNIKTEPSINFQMAGDLPDGAKDNNMMEVMAWWNQQQQTSRS